MNRLVADSGSKFFRVFLTSETEKQAKSVPPLFLAYLQNKIEAYATALVEQQIVYDPDPTKQMKSILELERLRNFITAYEELLAELLDAQQDMAPNQGDNAGTSQP